MLDDGYNISKNSNFVLIKRLYSNMVAEHQHPAGFLPMMAEARQMMVLLLGNSPFAATN